MWRLCQLDTLRCAALSGLGIWVSCQAAYGQTTSAASSAKMSVTIPSEASLTDERDAQFAQIAEEASFFERQQNLMRRVVKLVSPSILHIEATKETRVDGSLASSRSETKRIEEAGAGIIVELEGKPYALTNRHVIHTAANSAIKVETQDRTRLEVLQVWSDSSTDSPSSSWPDDACFQRESATVRSSKRVISSSPSAAPSDSITASLTELSAPKGDAISNSAQEPSRSRTFFKTMPRSTQETVVGR